VTPDARRLPEPGSMIGDGRFRLLGKLGEGGMAVVYLAADRVLGRDVALKLLVPRYLGRPEREQRLVNEAGYLAKMQGHPCIVELLDSGRLSDGGWPWLSTEFLSGQTLDSLLVRSKLEVARVIDIASQIAAALAACHERGVVHRDATPGNVFVLDDDNIKLFDFSHAGAVGGPRLAAGAPGRLTGAHDTPGTIGFMGPEQAAKAPADPTMDVFAFGALLFEMITRRNPFAQFADREAFIIAQRDGRAEMPRLHAFAYEVPEELAAIVHDCTLPKPADRPAMAEVCWRVKTLGGREVTVPPIVSASRKPARRRRSAALVLGGVAVVAVLGVGGIVLSRVDGAPADALPDWASDRSRKPEHGEPETRRVPNRDLIPGPESEPPLAPEPEPEPKVEPDPKPQPAPSPKSAPGVQPPQLAARPDKTVPTRTASCDGIEARGEEAFEQREWRSVLELTASKNCWRSSEQGRVRLRTTALYHLGRWEECANLGALSQHPDVLSLTQVCTSTANRKHPEAK
jgi:serine/threonine protein kinase